MSAEPIHSTLKNGRSVTIRQADISDAENLLNCLKRYIPDSDFIPRLQHEVIDSIQEEEKWIESFLTNHNSLLLIAEFEGEIIGNIDLTGSPRKIMEHTAMVGMGMLKEWRNTGLGSVLLQTAIDWATASPILELIWLQVYTENELGLGLYQKFGFEERGIIKNYFKRDGRYFDNLTMTSKVK